MLNDGMFSSAKDDWETPQDFFDRYNSEYHFTLDAASDDQNAKCKNHFTKETDGLHNSWGGETVWLNPPYGKTIGEWVRKAYDESRKPNMREVDIHFHASIEEVMEFNYKIDRLVIPIKGDDS